MASADRFRDSTQILLPAAALDGIREDLEREFTLTVREEGTQVRIIGSPVEIKAASDYLAMNGINLA
ncbi:hypothetical protein [Halomicrobium sp. LC1Hm]|uniref:VNG_1110C family protein n=1 Tax=Halomicrobium sp. LC1Hm TaxID=2610902 RepID=UPI001298391C|nr:hypothetical protein [Halomicrobium sp. LC1Hm]QGA82684.1 Uncharacterized protein LC1Hm_1639 [Halomicrobium sp. LC1Hm]